MPLICKHLFFKKLFICISILAISPVVFCQQKAIQGQISGKVEDESSKQSMEYVQVTIYNDIDTSLFDGTISDKKGEFVLKNIPAGKYLVSLEFIGYKSEKFNDITISHDKSNIDMGIIRLSPSPLEIDEVEIKAKETETIYSIDKKIIKVGSDLSSSGGSAVDILEDQAAVYVDAEENVSLRGSSNFTVLVNGRPGIFSGSEALKQIPAASVKSIEIITNPSVKYNPEGSAGIINVITRKNMLTGLNGLVSLSGTHDGSNNSGLWLEYKTRKINYNLAFTYAHSDKESERVNLTKTFTNDTVFFNHSFGKGGFIKDVPVIAGGMDIEINQNNQFSWGAGVSDLYNRTHRNIDYTLWYEPLIDHLFQSTHYIKKSKQDYKYLFFDYLHKFNDDGHEILWSGFIKDTRGNEDFTDREHNFDNVVTSMIDDSENSTRSYQRLKVEYTFPISDKLNFEAGYHIRHSTEFENYGFNYFDYLIDDSNPLMIYKNSSDYSQANQAVYSTFASEWKDIKYKIGVRGEYTQWEMIDSNNADNTTKINRIDWFPSIHLSYRFKGDHYISGSYSKRIDRPPSNYLEPFESYSGYYSKRIGNPALKPEYIDSYELNYRKSFKRGYYSVESYLKRSTNRIETYRSYLDETTTLYSVRNVGNDMRLGIQSALQVDLKDWWTCTFYSDIFYYKVLTDLSDSYTETSVVNLLMKNNFTILRKNYLQIEGIYNGGNITSQRIKKPSYLISASVRRSFFKNKLNVSFKVKDIFSMVKLEIVSKDYGYSTETLLVGYPPYYTLSVTYRINKLKKRKEHEEVNQKEVNEF